MKDVSTKNTAPSQGRPLADAKLVEQVAYSYTTDWRRRDLSELADRLGNEPVSRVAALMVAAERQEEAGEEDLDAFRTAGVKVAAALSFRAAKFCLGEERAGWAMRIGGALASGHPADAYEIFQTEASQHLPLVESPALYRTEFVTEATLWFADVLALGALCANLANATLRAQSATAREVTA